MLDRATIRIILPGAPRGKGRPRSRIAQTKTGQQFVHVYTDIDTRKYEAALKMTVRLVMRHREPLSGPLSVTIIASFPVPESWSKKKQSKALEGQIRPTSKPDYDNVSKLATDSLNGIVFVDDSQIVECTISKFYSDRPRLEITVYPLLGAPLFERVDDPSSTLESALVSRNAGADSPLSESS